MLRKRLAHLGAVAALTAGCSPATDDAPRGVAVPPAATATPGVTTAPAECADPQESAAGFLELRGLASQAEVWALPFGDYPASQGREIKIAWRMTGTGPLTLSATGPSGRRLTPLSGPDPHLGSNWDRPGDEWGSFWRFPDPGCWTIHLNRGTDRGVVGIRVTP